MTIGPPCRRAYLGIRDAGVIHGNARDAYPKAKVMWMVADALKGPPPYLEPAQVAGAAKRENSSVARLTKPN
jgi:hypothetical protein